MTSLPPHLAVSDRGTGGRTDADGRTDGRGRFGTRCLGGLWVGHGEEDDDDHDDDEE